MNYIEAVKELVNNPKAVAITFPTMEGGLARIIVKQRLYRDGMADMLYFAADEKRKERMVLGNCSAFLLREDFTVVYKPKESPNQAYLRGLEEGREMQRRAHNAIAAKKLREAYEALIGEKI